MSRADGPRGEMPANSAVNRVLEAERLAKKAIEGCRQGAAEVVESARRQARRIVERTDARVSAVHIRCDLDVAQRKAEIDAAARNIPTDVDLTEQDLAKLDEAVEALAAQLSGAAP
jgi:vacuolar-type H+-ATPase subunit H